MPSHAGLAGCRPATVEIFRNPGSKQLPEATTQYRVAEQGLNIFDDTIALLIPQDSIQEYRIVTNNFDAQYGRVAGGIVNVTTKPGTNNLHGDVCEFNRVSAYTANTFV